MANFYGGMTGSPNFQPVVDYFTAGNVNQFMTGQAANQYRMNLPQYDAMRGQQSENILDQLQGNLPDDVLIEILNQGARFGIGSGNAGGPGVNSAIMRNIGLSSIGQMEAGAKNLSQSIADTPVAELYNPMSLYVPQMLGQMEWGAAKQAEQGSQGTPFKWGDKSGSYIRTPGGTHTYWA